MKKYFLVITIFSGIVFFSNCGPSQKTTTAPVPKTTYANDLSVVIMNNCVPCHIPAKGGNKKAYDNYASAKTDIDEMIRRIELNPGDRGFMPFKKAKLSDSIINVFKKWKADGLPETAN